MTPSRPQLQIFNSLGRELVPFEPMTAGVAKVYTCGPTVYNDPHIGNLRTFVFEDLLRRTLRYLGYQVTQVMNLTDVEDKIIARAIERSATLDEVTAEPIEAFFRDLDLLGVERVEEYPRATEHVPEMIAMIETLLEKGFAYESDGSVFFRIAADEDYGRLSGIDLTQVRKGSRVADDEYGKDDARDFVLWKGAKEGEPSWSSPWGEGRPGLAHRVLGHESALPRTFVRHPLRRRRQHVSLITRTRLLRAKAPTAAPSCATGCTPSICSSTAQRCRSRSATSTPWRT